MFTAGVPNQDRLPLDAMSRPAIRRAPINGVLVVEAAASRVEFNQLVAHLEPRARDAVLDFGSAVVAWGGRRKATVACC